MTLSPADAFDRGLDFFGEVADSLSPEDWDRPSPCAGWTALDVLGHLTTAMDMGLSVLRGEQPSWPQVERMADLVPGEPAATFHQVAAACRAALATADLTAEMETPMGPRTVEQRLAFPAIDLYVHGWDVAKAAGRSVAIPDDVIEFAHATLDDIPPAMMRGDGGVFAAEVEVGPDASASDRFLAWTGRDPA